MVPSCLEHDLQSIHAFRIYLLVVFCEIEIRRGYRGQSCLTSLQKKNEEGEATGKTHRKNNEVAIECLFIPREGKGKHRVKPINKQTKVYDLEKRVRESVTQGEGISTPHVRRTRRDPLLLVVNLWVLRV